MKNLALTLSLLACAALPLAAGAADDLHVGHVYAIGAENGSGEHGTFAVKPRGDVTVIEVHLLGAPEGVVQPAHLHLGTCAKLNPTPFYPLKPIEDGISETDVHIPLATLTAKGVALNVHASASRMTYVACGTLAR